MGQIFLEFRTVYGNYGHTWLTANLKKDHRAFTVSGKHP